MARKLRCRGVILAVRPGRLFYVTNSVSGRRYLVDTGSAFSIMPWESTAVPSGPTLTAANGRHIPCWGERSFAVTIAGVARRWDFLLAAVSFPVIGIDFLCHHGLLVDVANLHPLAGPPPPAAVCAITSVSEAARPRSYAEVAVGRPLPPAGSSPPSPSSSPPSPVYSSATLPTLPLSADWATALCLRFPAVFAGPFGNLCGSSPSRGAAHHHHHWPAVHRQVPPPGPFQAGGSQGGVPGHAGRGGHTPLQQPVEQPPSHGEEKGRFLVSLRRLSPPQPSASSSLSGCPSALRTQA